MIACDLLQADEERATLVLEAEEPQAGQDPRQPQVIVVAGVPFGTPGATNMLRIAYVGADAASN